MLTPTAPRSLPHPDRFRRQNRARRRDCRDAICALLLCLLVWTPPATASAEDSESLSWDRIGVWAGYRIAGQRIQRAFVSEGESLKTRIGWRRVVEADIANAGRVWRSRCVLTHLGMLEYTVACTFDTTGVARATLTLIGGRQSDGFLLGPTRLKVFGELFNLERLQLSFVAPSGEQRGRWQIETPLRATGTRLRFAAAASPLERELIAVVVLTSQLFSVRDMGLARTGTPPGGVLDAYPLERAPAPDLSRQASVLDTLGARPHAALLRRFPGLAIDRKAGPLVKRRPNIARVVTGLHGGITAASGGEASPSGVDGGSIGVYGGARVQRLSIQVGMDLMPGVVDQSSLSKRVGVTGVDSAAFSFGLQARYAFGGAFGIEPTLGLTVSARVRFVDVAEWADTQGATQVGVALSPSLGLQLPLWRPNDLGTRLLLTADVVPEWTRWGRARVNGPLGTDESQRKLGDALSGGELSYRGLLGLRFEL